MFSISTGDEDIPVGHLRCDATLAFGPDTQIGFSELGEVVNLLAGFTQYNMYWQHDCGVLDDHDVRTFMLGNVLSGWTWHTEIM